jgi:hypothetical protein
MASRPCPGCRGSPWIPIAGDAYLRFLQLAEAIRGLPTLPPLDPLEERILSWVARAGSSRSACRCAT